MKLLEGAAWGPPMVFQQVRFSEELIDKLCPSGNEIELTYLQIYLDRIFGSQSMKRKKERRLFFQKSC